MANSRDDSRDPERPRPEGSALSNSGIDRSDSWGDSDLAPEEDELHVLDLLQKLETESNNGAAPVYETRTQQPTKWAQWDPEVTCAACNYLNAADQRFCGYCGAALQVRDLPRADRASLSEPPLRRSQPTRPQPTRLQPSASSFDRKPAAKAASGFSPASAQAREKQDTDLEFLRYKTLGASAPSRAWKVPVAIVVFAIAGVVGYRMYNGLSILPRQGTPVSRPGLSAANVQTSGEKPSLPSTSGADGSQLAPATAALEPSKPEISAAKPKTSAALRGEIRGALTPATQRLRENPAAGTGPNAAAIGGEAELAQAERYLSPSSRDSAEAAKWLWKSVGKENPAAVLLLSDLYAKGDGVPRNCDQARLLLMVAAKKGQAAASSRLRSFNTGACQ